MESSPITVTVFGSNNGNDASVAGNYGPGTYEFYVEDANGEFSEVQTITLTEVPCVASPITNPETTVGLTSCETGQGSVVFNWDEGELPVTIYYQQVDFVTDLGYNEVVVNNDSYTLTPLSPAQYEYYIQDSNGNATPVNYFTILQPPAINIRIRTASALKTAMGNDEYQNGNQYNNNPTGGVYNTALFDFGNELTLNFGSIVIPQDYMFRENRVRDSIAAGPTDVFAGPETPFNAGIWRYPLLIEMFMDYTVNGAPLQGWFEIKTKVQNVYTSQVPAGVYNLDRLLVFKDYLPEPFDGEGNAYWNEYVWLNDVDYSEDVNYNFRTYTQTELNIMGYELGTYYNFTPQGYTGNYPTVYGNLLGLDLNGVPNPPTDFPKRKVDTTTFGDDPEQFCVSPAYAGANPWSWVDSVYDDSNSGRCTAITNFYVNYQKLVIDSSGLPTVNPNLVSVSNCKNYYTNFCATYLDEFSTNDAFSNDDPNVGPLPEPLDFQYPLNFFDFPDDPDLYSDTFDTLEAICGEGFGFNGYTAEPTPAELNGLSWNQRGIDIFLENFNGTSVIERTFTFGSELNPLTINGNIVNGINYSSVGLKLEWFAVYQAYNDNGGFCCGGETTLNNCQSAKGLQVEVIFHPTDVPNCPTTNTPQPIKYFRRDPIIENITGEPLPDLVGEEVLEYIASMKVQGSTSNRPNLFAHLSPLRIIDI
jgi:hypothetical protein